MGSKDNETADDYTEIQNIEDLITEVEEMEDVEDDDDDNFSFDEDRALTLARLFGSNISK